MTQEATLHPIRRAAHAHQEQYLSLLEGLVRHESPTPEVAACDVLAQHMQGVLAELGWQVERISKREVGDQLIARLDVAKGPSTLLLTHYDTVWPLGTLEQMPFKRDGDKVFGPGTLDMKAGIVNAMLAPKVVEAAGLALAGPLTLLLTSDEESGSLQSRELIESLAQQHDRVVVLEPGREDGAVKVGRKGTGGFKVRFEGESAHAGNNPQDGASALRELSHFLFFSEDLNDEEAGTSVNLTVARGGTVTNVIAEEAEASIDMRALVMREGQRVEEAVHGYTPRDSRVNVVVSGGLNRPPLEPTEQNQALYRELVSRAEKLGLSLSSAVVGGGSDGNFTSALGIPTLDGMGSVGAGPHARHEHIRLAESLDRVALLAGFLARTL